MILRLVVVVVVPTVRRFVAKSTTTTWRISYGSCVDVVCCGGTGQSLAWDSWSVVQWVPQDVTLGQRRPALDTLEHAYISDFKKVVEDGIYGCKQGNPPRQQARRQTNATQQTKYRYRYSTLRTRILHPKNPTTLEYPLQRTLHIYRKQIYNLYIVLISQKQTTRTSIHLNTYLRQHERKFFWIQHTRARSLSLFLLHSRYV